MSGGDAEKVRIAGVDIDNVSFDDVLLRIDAAIKSRRPCFIVTCNVDHIVKLNRDAGFMSAYRAAAVSVPDGVPVLWAAAFLGTPLKEKISGSDLMPRLCAISADRGYKLFFLGGKPGSAAAAAEVLKGRHPALKVVGVYSPPFGFEADAAENARIAGMVRSAAPDILFVGLGAPKQEKWIYAHQADLGVPVSIGVGATFEFVAGVVRRAPLWMQRAGLEWLWRLAMEPKRLWRRYLVEDLEFFRLVLKQKLGKSAGRTV
jgi:N-acetylglucosaminyldiphosphoundecaprenol N-acetyl-beta-D-mannosaminyltransferase